MGEMNSSFCPLPIASFLIVCGLIISSLPAFAEPNLMPVSASDSIAEPPPLSTPPEAPGKELPKDLIVSAEIAKQFTKLGGSPKALKHLSCVLQRQRQTRFGLKEVKNKKDVSMVNKCNRVEGGKAEVSINRDDYALIVDFTRPPTERRMFLIPIKGAGKVESYFTGHGRFGNTPRDTATPGEKGNAINMLKFFSNKPNSNATATGLYVAGTPYRGRYDGPTKEVTKKNKKGKKRVVKVKVDPKHPKPSLVLHGVEADVNDNACIRATVIHGTTKISENGKEAGVHLMSSGCPMVDYKAVSRIVDHVKGAKDKGGAAILAYGPREAALDDNYYCDLRADQQVPVKEPEVTKPEEETAPADDGVAED